MVRLPSSNDDAAALLANEFEDGRMRCASCGQAAVPAHTYGQTIRSLDGAALILAGPDKLPWFTVAIAICASCGADNVFMRKWTRERSETGDPDEIIHWQRRVEPLGRGTKSLPNTPPSLLKDYGRACATIDVSPAASACMSRRCLQGILEKQGYTQRDLADQIAALLADKSKPLPPDLYDTVDAIRQFGNFGAHRKPDRSTLEIIEVEAGEAEWCIEISERLMEHFHEQPARSKARLEAMKEKLGRNKSPAKT